MDSEKAQNDIIWKACKPTKAVEKKGNVIITIPFQAQKRESMEPDTSLPRQEYELLIRAYGENIVRTTISYKGKFPKDKDNVMLEWDPSLEKNNLELRIIENGWKIYDETETLKMKIDLGEKPVKKWSDQIQSPFEEFSSTIYPDKEVAVPFMDHDHFTPDNVESISLGFVEREQDPHRCMYSLYAQPQEKFAGTGERFSRMDLSGETFILENTDAYGVNSRRAYKNIPFYVSNRPYGLLNLTSAHVKLSLADISTRAAQGLIEDNKMDLFFIGGGSIEKIIYNYRRVTGFPRKVPLWSYGIWMSRMTYFSAAETKEVAQKLREKEFPCDVIHLDTGWFKKDWKCEWEFNRERFPDPEKYMQEMREMGFRISLWQLPSVGEDTKHFSIS